MDRNTVNWRGYIPAITTPFTRDGALDTDALHVQVAWLADEGIQGAILAGTSGEWFSMSEKERAELFAAGAEHRSGAFPVLGACNAFTPHEAITHARAAQAAGLDGILLTPPPYIVPNRKEIVAFYRAVSDATDIPMTVYNWPRGCVVDMDVDLLAELAQIENVVAIKNSTGDFASFLAGMYALEGEVRYFGLPTNALGADLAMLGHGDGLMGTGGILGRDQADFWNAVDGRAWRTRSKSRSACARRAGSWSPRTPTRSGCSSSRRSWNAPGAWTCAHSTAPNSTTSHRTCHMTSSRPTTARWKERRTPASPLPRSAAFPSSGL
jgi:4-hydroxy-tetrahydrodipicolinate synthase